MSSMDGKTDAQPWFYKGVNGVTRQNPEADWTDKQRAAAAMLYPDKVPDPANAIDVNGKAVFDASFTHKYQVTEKDMTDMEKIMFKQYQLFKATLKIDRRDSIYEAFATADFTNGAQTHNWFGAPYAVIEPRPHIGDLFITIRWYEHIAAAATSVLFYAWIRGKPQTRYSGAYMNLQRGMLFWSFFMFEGALGIRAMNRLRGCLENDVECERFGVMESSFRLAEKAKYWERYRKYKEEWMKRYDYYVWGLRPGERFSLFSPCHLPPMPVLYNKRTDYQMRKNPFILSERPISESQKVAAMEYLRMKGRTPHPLDITRPERKYYGPLGTNVNSPFDGVATNRGAANGNVMV